MKTAFHFDADHTPTERWCGWSIRKKLSSAILDAPDMGIHRLSSETGMTREAAEVLFPTIMHFSHADEITDQREQP